MEQTIRNIIATLEGIKAEGPENWNRLLACDQALKGLLDQLEAQKTANKQEA